MFKNFTDFYLDSFRGLSREIWILSLITFVNRSGTVVILFLTLYLTQELGFSFGDAGIIAGCYGVGSLIGSYIGGILTDRIGYYHIVLGSQILVGLLFLILLSFTDFYILCAMVMLTSAVGDSYRPASMTAISAYSKPENHTRSLSLYRLAINLGFAGGAGAAGVLAQHFGYHWLFVMDGVTCIASAILFGIFLKNKPTTDNSDNPSTPTQRSVFADTWYIFFLLFLLLNSIAFVQLFSAFPVFCRDMLQLTEGQIGFIMTMNGILLVIIEMPIVHYLVNRKADMESIIWGVILIGLGYLGFNIFGFYYWVAIYYMVMISLGEILNFPFANSVAMARSTVSNRGQYMGLYSMLWSASSILGPWIGLKIAEDFGFDYLWYFLGAICLVSTLGLIFLHTKETAVAVIQE